MAVQRKSDQQWASAAFAVWALRALLLAFLLCFANAWAGSIEVIVNKDRAGMPADRDTLRAMFTTRLRQWPDGAPVRVFVMPDDNALHDRFCREQLGMYPYVLRQIWDRLQFTGTGLTPTVVRSEAEMRERVNSTPGAVGYVTAADSDTAAGAARPNAQRPEKAQ